jgi:hypothetical protein
MNELTKNRITGLAGFIVLAAINIAIFAYDRLVAEGPVMGREPYVECL